jgi:hypothetical protein
MRLRKQWMKPRDADDIVVLKTWDKYGRMEQTEISLRYVIARELYGTHASATDAISECEASHLNGDCPLCGRD